MIYIVLLLIVQGLGKLKVVAPETLKNYFSQTGEIKYSVANFGNVPWGRRISGILDLANPIDGCSEMNSTVKGHFILIRRGECTFVTKVRNAQNAGYQMAIIEDNKKEIIDNLTMADDGTGYSIQIPSIIISKSDGEALTKQLQKNSTDMDPIQLLIKFDVKQQEKVDVLFAFSMVSAETYKFIREFQPYYKDLKDEKINYTLLYPLFQIAPNPLKPTEFENCISFGKYCAEDPDGVGIGNGKMIVEETLRQLCIFNQDTDKWFEYMLSFRNNCTKPQMYSECSPAVQLEVGIDNQKVEQCIRNGEEDQVLKTKTENIFYKTNKILDEQLAIWNTAGVEQIPGIIINHQDYRGRITGANVFIDICYSFTETPESCGNYVEGYVFQSSSSSSLTLTILMIIGIMIFFFIIVFCVYTKLVRKEFAQNSSTQVNEMVTQYIQFYESKNKKNKEEAL